MLYLKQPSNVDLQEYYDKLKDNIIEARDAANIRQEAKNFLTPAKIKEILTDVPGKLMAHHDAFMPELYPAYNAQQYEQVFELKKKFKKTTADKALINQYMVQIAPIFEIFDYKKFLSGSKSRSYNLAEKLGRNTCTYCNRLYSNTIIYRKNGKKTTNDDDRIARPDFDHWFAHSRYPLFGLSFFNLIPSCGVCNTSVKGADKFMIGTHIHPYVQEADQHFKFSFYHKDTDQPNVRVIPTGDKMKRHLEAFKIMEVYNAHSNLELKDLLDLKYKYSDDYINTMFDEAFKTLKVDKKDVYRLIFGVEYDEEHFHKRTFSKFKRDILNELDIMA